MTTIVNAKVDLTPPAKGDGQKQTLTISITNGSKNFSTSSTGPFVVGDIGKYLAFSTGGTPFISLIDAVPTAQSVTLHDTYTETTLSGSSQTVEWGHDDSPAFLNFQSTYAGMSDIQLNCPTGRYCFVTGTGGTVGSSSIFPFFSVLNLRVLSSDGDSLAVFTDMQGAGTEPFMGSCRAGVPPDQTYTAKIATVAAGSTQVQLLTPSERSLFTVGKYLQCSGLCVQDFGNPNNPYYYEYHVVTNIDVSGLITLDGPLKYGYKSTWTDWTSDSGLTCGAARVLPANENQIPGINGGIWDTTHTYEGLGLEFLFSGSAFNQIDGRDISILGGYSLGQCPIPSGNISWTIDGMDLTGCGAMEIDKQVITATVKNLTMHGITGFNPEELLILDNVHMLGGLNGTGKSCIIRNGCIIQASPILGPESYGTSQNTNTFTASDSTFLDAIGIPGNSVANVQSLYSISNGVISFPKAGNDVAYWAVPGNWILGGGFGGHSTYGPAFQIIDTFDSAGTVYITTSLTGGWPANGFGGLITASAPQMTMTNCTGSEEALSYSNCEPGAVKNSRWNRTYTNNIGTTLPTIPVFGKITSATFTVTGPYSGGTFDLDSPFVVQMSDDSITNWGLSIDLTHAGVRTITYRPATDDYQYTGAVGADALNLPYTGKTWMFGDQMVPKMRSATGSGTIQFQLNTDQGIVQAGTVGAGWSWLGGRSR
jgi:hypothetical protein